MRILLTLFLVLSFNASADLKIACVEQYSDDMNTRERALNFFRNNPTLVCPVEVVDAKPETTPFELCVLSGQGDKIAKDRIIREGILCIDEQPAEDKYEFGENLLVDVVVIVIGVPLVVVVGIPLAIIDGVFDLGWAD